MDLVQKILQQTVVDNATGCFNWTGTVNTQGRAIAVYKKRSISAARALWMSLHNVQLTPDKFVCHHCDNILCVNPDHLYLGDKFTNAQDKLKRGRHRTQNTGKTHCIRGHEFTPENTWVNKKTNMRLCRICQRLRSKKYYLTQRKKSAD
jgi:hypothetical protein